MMVPFDGSGAPPQGQPTPQPLPRPPLQPGHVQTAPSPVMPPSHHQPMNAPHFGRASGSMGGQPPYPMPPSPARQGSFNGSMQGSSGQYSSHPPLHSPHHTQGGLPMHPSMGHPPQPMHRSGSSNGRHSGGMGQNMPPMMNQHDPMRTSTNQGSHQRQQQPQQQPQFMNNSSNNALSGNWQSDKDTPHRREMIQHIVRLLKRDKSGSPESMSKLPQMAKQLEVSLYRKARSFEEYVDMLTLKQRLQDIAFEVSRGRQRQDGRREENQFDSSSQFNNRVSNPEPGSNSLWGTGSSNSSRDFSNQLTNSGSSHGGVGGMRPQLNDRRPPPPSAPSSSGNRDDWRVRIRHKQQRLLLLHHSAKCPHEDGRCTMTPHCADMKRLWRHMEGCKDNNCRVPHCFSSRAILSHYRKCKDPNCPACGPVRETVKKAKGASRSPNNTSTGPMMNAMLDMPSSGVTSSNQHGLSSSSDPLGSTSAGNHMQPRPTGAMPPPPSTSSQVPYNASSSSHYRQTGSSTGLPSTTSSQQSSQSVPSYRPELKSSEARTAISSSQSNGRPLDVPSTGSTPPPMLSNGLSNGSSRTNAIVSGGGNGRSDSGEWQKIRHKQQRLLLLRHASRCQHDEGTCPVTPHCASMKKLWQHIAHCKNQQCTVQHCLSSRYVLSHYRRCKDARCPACGPVRETIRKSHEREKGNQQSHGGPSFDTEMATSRNSASERPGPFGDAQIESFQPEAKRMKTEQDPLKEEFCEPVLNGSSSPVDPPAMVSDQSVQDQVAEKAPAEEPVAEPIIGCTSPSLPDKTESLEADKTHVKDDEVRNEPSSPRVHSHIPAKTQAQAQAPSKPATDQSLLNCFTVKELETHLASLDRKTQLSPAKLKSKCLEVLKGLQTHQHGWVFNSPVDPVELRLPDYFDVIKRPMDLGTIQKRLENGSYHSIDDFQADVYLTFDNAMTYNENGSVVYDMAKELKSKFTNDMKILMTQLDAENKEKRQNERACTLCGCEKLLFEPPVYFCNGMNCQSSRIRRNSHFYIGGNNQYFWCSTCYNELDESIPIELADMTIMKKDLKKKKNDEVHEESWVQCDTCERWVHQICGLFNTRQNKEHHSEYCCPRCLHAKRKESGDTGAGSPRPPGAVALPRTALSEWLEHRISKKIERKKRQYAEEKSENEGISLEAATAQVETGGPIIIRQVTAMDRKLEVRELMQKRYAHKNYPSEFPFRCKCILVFQTLDGVDVVLFALYVYEHGEDNPPPNKRCVYISYLDSVHFMRPRKIRTFVYHEILIAYLDYARRKGFATAHIWACPPLRGDDYIFYAKPEDQKTPRDSRLRQWYIDMLTECQRRSIVGRVTNMFDLYFADESLDATAVPYLEGDYFPGEAENIIKLLQEGGGKKGGGGGKKKKNKSGTKNKSSTGTRSTGVDEEALLASGILEGAKNLKELDRDQVMVKLGETIHPMKDSFIVAFLNWSGAREEDKVVPEAVEKARAEYAEKDTEELSGSKRDAQGLTLHSRTDVDENGAPVKVIDDDAEDLDCEILNNRQAFLNLCRGNHYQFDELRRAKHTSMMVLWHLHNRDAPKFVQQCVSCSREILSGKRYHCNVCSDYDLCEECFKDPNVNRGSCTHQLQPIAVEPDANQDRSGLTEAERLQRQRNLMLHIQLIEHASRCNTKTCTSSNCEKMRKYLQHARSCRVKVQGGCKICKRIWTLLRIHAQKCKDPNCAIPQCNAIREKMRQLQKQQQAMDDRRRLEMNRHMRGGGGVVS